METPIPDTKKSDTKKSDTKKSDTESKKILLKRKSLIDLRVLAHKYAQTQTQMSNEKIITEFKKLVNTIKNKMNTAEDQKERTRQSFRLKQTESFIAFLDNYETQIHSGEDLKGIKGIGKGTIEKVDEILKTGELVENSATKATAEEIAYTTAIAKLTSIHGIGAVKAKKFYEKGYTNHTQLLNAFSEEKIKLTNDIRIGVQYYDILHTRIPREEITKIITFLKKFITKHDLNIKLEGVGSYRRGCITSGDMDVLITGRIEGDGKEHDILNEFIELLKTEGAIIETLGLGTTKFMGIIKIKTSTPVHIDIRYVPPENWACGLMYFTGSKLHNILMRQVCLKQGKTLNEYNLSCLDKETQIVGESIPVRTEKEIYENLGIIPLKPIERDF